MRLSTANGIARMATRSALEKNQLPSLAAPSNPPPPPHYFYKLPLLHSFHHATLINSPFPLLPLWPSLLPSIHPSITPLGETNPSKAKKIIKTSRFLDLNQSSDMDCSSFSSLSSSSSSSSSDLEAGFSGSAPSALHPSSSNNDNNKRKGSYRGMVGSPRPRFFCDPLSDDEPRHFLDSCFLCKKPLGGNRDIFMYRGDTPFCSEECRQEQIEMDEAKEKNWKHSLKASPRKEKQAQNQTSNATSPPKAQKIHVRAGTVVAG